MTSLMRFIALHDTAIGLVGTAIVVLAAIIGYGRHHAVASERQRITPARD